MIYLLALVFGAKSGPLISGGPQWLKTFGPNLSFFTIVGYHLYYSILDPVASVSFYFLKRLFYNLSCKLI